MGDQETDIPRTNVKTAIILDGSYFFMALYNKLEGQWKKKSTIENTRINTSMDMNLLIFMENIKIFLN